MKHPVMELVRNTFAAVLVLICGNLSGILGWTHDNTDQVWPLLPDTSGTWCFRAEPNVGYILIGEQQNRFSERRITVQTQDGPVVFLTEWAESKGYWRSVPAGESPAADAIRNLRKAANLP